MIFLVALNSGKKLLLPQLGLEWGKWKPIGIPPAPRVFGLFSFLGCGLGFTFRKSLGEPSIFSLGSSLCTVGNLPRGSIHHATSLPFPPYLILNSFNISPESDVDNSPMWPNVPMSMIPSDSFMWEIWKQLHLESSKIFPVLANSAEILICLSNQGWAKKGD